MRKRGRTALLSAALVLAAVLSAATVLAGCGGHGHRSRTPQAGQTAPAAATSTAGAGGRVQGNGSSTLTQATPPPPQPVRLELELPLVGLSSAPLVSYSTTAPHPALRGIVTPAGTTVYMLAPDGSRTAVNPHANGAFTVHPKLYPGPNTFQFTAAKLGANSARASLAVSWRGPAAAAMRREIASDPAKFLPPASAGLNHKLAPIGNPPTIARGAQAVSFQLDPIKAGAPPLDRAPGKWLGGFELTEYYPALESWFVGQPVSAPGIAGRHRIDWLYSAHGLSMEGDGIGLDGHQYHVQDLGTGGWLTASGRSGARFGIGADAPYWRTGGFWRTAEGALTFPLAAGGWSDGVGVRYVPPPGITFAPGPSRPLTYLRSVAVDPRVIPLGSHIYIPAYKSINGGWFEADDTGGAIIGRHIDVFRPPPSKPADQGNFATGQRVYVIPPGASLP
jgi:3D (Asp-Asp-Asp) domain-containing protein